MARLSSRCASCILRVWLALLSRLFFGIFLFWILHFMDLFLGFSQLSSTAREMKKLIKTRLLVSHSRRTPHSKLAVSGHVHPRPPATPTVPQIDRDTSLFRRDYFYTRNSCAFGGSCGAGGDVGVCVHCRHRIVRRQRARSCPCSCGAPILPVHPTAAIKHILHLLRYVLCLVAILRG